VAVADAEDLVMLHGFGGTRRTWDLVLGHLPGERYRPLALDLPGHGAQAGAPRPIDLDGAVASVLRRSPRRFALCGYSMGGRIALHVALSAPERVSRLVIVAAGPGIKDAGERAARRAADRALAQEIERAPIERFVERWCAQPMFARDPPEVDALAREDYRRNDPAALAAALRALGQGEMPPLWDRLAELRMPVTVLAGERDAKLRAIAERLRSSLPSARAIVVKGGHRLPLESPQALADAIDRQRRGR
jgi:2-succinyl-6-hydroxy-2,4-cyclohexadiene-1-carboxylate synthase